MAIVTYVRFTSADGKILSGESGTWIPTSALQLTSSPGGNGAEQPSTLSFGLAADDAIADTLDGLLYSSGAPLGVEVATYDDAAAGPNSAGTLVSYAVSSQAYLTGQSAGSGANSYALTLQSLSQTSYVDDRAYSAAYGAGGASATPTPPSADVADGSAVAGSTSAAPAPADLSYYAQFTDKAGNLVKDAQGDTWFAIRAVQSGVDRPVSFGAAGPGAPSLGRPVVNDVSFTLADPASLSAQLLSETLQGTSGKVHVEAVAGTGAAARVVDSTTYTDAVVDSYDLAGAVSVNFKSQYTEHLGSDGAVLSSSGYSTSTARPDTGDAKLAASLPPAITDGPTVDHTTLTLGGGGVAGTTSQPALSVSNTRGGSVDVSNVGFTTSSGALARSLDPTIFDTAKEMAAKFDQYAASDGGADPRISALNLDGALLSGLDIELVTGVHSYNLYFRKFSYDSHESSPSGSAPPPVSYDLSTSTTRAAAAFRSVRAAAAPDSGAQGATASAAPEMAAAALPGSDNTAYIQFRDARTGAVLAAPGGQGWFALGSAGFGVSRDVSSTQDSGAAGKAPPPNLGELGFTLGPSAVTGTLDTALFRGQGLTIEVASYTGEGVLQADYLFGGGSLTSHNYGSGTGEQGFSYGGETTFQETQYDSAGESLGGYSYNASAKAGSGATQPVVGGATQPVAAGAAPPPAAPSPSALDTYVQFIGANGTTLAAASGATWFRVPAPSSDFSQSPISPRGGQQASFGPLQVVLGDTDVVTQLDAALLRGDGLKQINVASYGSDGAFSAAQTYSGVAFDEKDTDEAGNAFTFSYTGYGESLSEGPGTTPTTASAGTASGPAGAPKTEASISKDAITPADLSSLSFFGELKVGGKPVFAGEHPGFVALPGFSIGVQGSSGGSASFAVSLSQAAALASALNSAPSGGPGGVRFEVAGYSGDARSIDYVLSGVQLQATNLDAASGLESVLLSYTGIQETKTTKPGDYRTASSGGAQRIDASASGQPTVCFCTGVRILTARGEVAVDALEVGDLAVTASGAHRPVRWIGRQEVDCAAHPRPHEVMPVRITAGAIGEGRPARDLWVSPGHALALDMMGEVLVPASALVNGATVAQVAVERVTYWHVELDSHDVLLADGQPAESYMDTGNRAFFGTGEGNLDPARTPATLADYCRPFHDGGALVAAARHQLRARAVSLGLRLAGERLGALHIVCDGARVEAEADGLAARFAVPACARDVWLCSRTGAPLHGSGDPAADPRRLGLCVAQIRIDDGLTAPRTIAPGDVRLGAEGWHAAEADHRWTDGRARLDPALWVGCRGLFFLRVDLAQACLPGWKAPEGLALSEAPGATAEGEAAPLARGLRLVRVA